jgi:hypothetical protein
MWRFSQRVTRQDLEFKLGKEFAPIKTDTHKGCCRRKEAHRSCYSKS